MHLFLKSERGREQCSDVRNHNVFHKCKIRAAESSYGHYQVIKGRQNTVTVRDDIVLSPAHIPKEIATVKG